MDVKQKYIDYKLALAKKAVVEQKLDSAKIEISYPMDVQTYAHHMSNGMNIPKCVILVLLESGRESVVQKCGSFDKDLDCPECKNCKHYYRRQNYMQLEKEFKIARQQAKVARKNLIDEIKNIFTLRR